MIPVDVADQVAAASAEAVAEVRRVAAVVGVEVDHAPPGVVRDRWALDLIGRRRREGRLLAGCPHVGAPVALLLVTWDDRAACLRCAPTVFDLCPADWTCDRCGVVSATEGVVVGVPPVVVAGWLCAGCL